MRRALVSITLSLLACSDRFAPEEVVDGGAEAASPAPVADASPDHDTHHASEACDTVGRTGAADTCKLFAYCGHRSFEVDCAARFTCVCSEPDIDGGATKQIAAQPVFCESPSSELKSAFDAARRACGW